jgi:hypothetical protein
MCCASPEKDTYQGRGHKDLEVKLILLCAWRWLLQIIKKNATVGNIQSFISSVIPHSLISNLKCYDSFWGVKVFLLRLSLG